MIAPTDPTCAIHKCDGTAVEIRNGYHLCNYHRWMNDEGVSIERIQELSRNEDDEPKGVACEPVITVMTDAEVQDILTKRREHKIDLLTTDKQAQLLDLISDAYHKRITPDEFVDMYSKGDYKG